MTDRLGQMRSPYLAAFDVSREHFSRVKGFAPVEESEEPAIALYLLVRGGMSIGEAADLSGWSWESVLGMVAGIDDRCDSREFLRLIESMEKDLFLRLSGRGESKGKGQ